MTEELVPKELVHDDTEPTGSTTTHGAPAKANGVGMIESRPRSPVGSRIGRSTGAPAGVFATVFDTAVAIDAVIPLSLELCRAGWEDGQRLIQAREWSRGG